MDMVWNIFFMFGGVAAMMIGMKVMGSALEKFAGGGMKRLLGKATTNRFAGVGVGVAVTSIIQSSTATTVMLVGFVNVGVMTLVQATNVIMGANIGTTVTAWLVSLAGVGTIDVGAIAAIIGFIGVMMGMIVKNEKVGNIGNILGGLGLIFVGLEFISIFAKEIMLPNGNPSGWVELIFQGDYFPLLLILIGIVLTALVHSSSTITSLMVVLASLSVLSFENALFLALGSNIGTCITSIMSSIGTRVNAKRTAIVHLLFNTFGCLLFLAPIWVWKTDIANLFASISSDTGMQIAAFHTLFNIITTAVLLPFTKYVVKLACLIVPDKKTGQEAKHSLTFIDNRLLETPPIAVANTKKEIQKMSEIAIENINIATNMLITGDLEKEELLKDNEEALNFLNRNITSFLTTLMGKELTNADERSLGSYYHVVSDLERVGDYAENIMEYAFRMNSEGMEFSDEAIAELKEVITTINSLYSVCIKAFINRDESLLSEIDVLEESIDQASHELENRHIERVKKGECTVSLGSMYLQTIANLERVGDHITNVAYSIKNFRHH